MRNSRASRNIVPALALAAALWALPGLEARAQGGPVTVSDITVESGAVTYRIPRIEIRGGNLSEAEIRSLFVRDAGNPLERQVGRLSAEEVIVPELVIEQPVGTARQKTTYRDIVLSGVAGGRIASVSAGGGLFETSGADSAGSGRFGRLAASDFDLGRTLALTAEKADGGRAEWQRLYASFSLEDIVTAGPSGQEFRIGRIAGRDLKARPTKESWSETMRLLGELNGAQGQTDAAKQRALVLSADLLDSFDFGTFEVLDIQSRGTENAKDPTIRIARMAYAGPQPGRLSEATVEGMDVVAPEAEVRIASLRFSGFSFEAPIAALRSAGDQALAPTDPAAMRRMLPNFGTVRLAGVEVVVPRSGSDGGAPTGEPMRFALRSFELGTEKPINGIPSAIRIALDNVTFPIAADANEEGVRELAAMGYRSADLSTQVALAWNEATRELALRDMSVRGASMGSIALRGTFGNVGRDLFDTDTAVASVALVAATLKSVDLSVDNGGLAEKLLAQQAADQKRSPEELRREYGMTAAVGIPALLGNSPQAKALGSAVARFIAKPNRLAITARTRDGAGLGASDLALLGDPNALMSKIDLSAKAE